MSLTPPPPPPPPPHNLRSGIGPAGCKTPRLARPPSRRLSAQPAPGSGPSQSPNQLREILADITRQVNNSPDSQRSSALTASIRPSHNHLRRNLTSSSLLNSPLNGSSSSSSSSSSGPITRSRSMVISTTSRRTPRTSRSNTPVTNENVGFNPTVESPTPYRRNFLNRANSVYAEHLQRLTPLTAGSSRSSDQGSQHPGSPLAMQENRARIIPLRLRAPSSASISSSSSPPQTDSASVTTTEEPVTPSSSASASTSSSSVPNRQSNPPPPLRAPDCPESAQPSNLMLRSSSREIRPIDTLEQPNGRSSSKRRRRNTTGLGRL